MHCPQIKQKRGGTKRSFNGEREREKARIKLHFDNFLIEITNKISKRKKGKKYHLYVRDEATRTDYEKLFVLWIFFSNRKSNNT